MNLQAIFRYPAPGLAPKQEPEKLHCLDYHLAYSVPGQDQQHHSYTTSVHVAWGDLMAFFQEKISLLSDLSVSPLPLIGFFLWIFFIGQLFKGFGSVVDGTQGHHNSVTKLSH